MELSLQKRIGVSSVSKARANLIKKENLHIDDRIDYAKFLELYEKYKNKYSEEDFAKYFLDIPRLKLYYIRVGKTKETQILTREFVSNRYLSNIRKNVLQELKKRNLGKKLYYSEILELYEKFGGKLSLKVFAEETLNVSPHNVETIKSDTTKQAIILKEASIDPNIISKSLNFVTRYSGLHIGDQISLEEFRDVYQKYGFTLTEREFAVKVLGIAGNQINRLLIGKSKTVGVFSKYIYDPEEIARLREKVIKEEKLHIGDLIDNARFLELHKKYGGILSEEIFADEILDINEIGVKNMRVAGTNSAVLGDIEVPKKYLENLSMLVATEERLASKYEITKPEFEAIYEKYGGVLSKRQFATEVLKSSKDSISAFLLGTFKKTAIYAKEEITDFEALRKQVIEEAHLHFNDSMDYYEFDSIRKRFAPNMPESIFASKVLDMTPGGFNGMKTSRGKYRTYILMNEKLPTKEEMASLRKKVLCKHHLHIKDSITYEQFKKIHYEDGGIIPDYMFAEKILDISNKKFREITLHPDKENALVLINTKVPIQEVLKLRHDIRSKFEIEKGKLITWEDFEEYYNSENHILSERMFANAVLGINGQSINKLRNGKSVSIRARQTEYDLEKLDWVDSPKPVKKASTIPPKRIIKRVRRNVDFSSEIKFPEIEENDQPKKFVYKSGKSATKAQAKSILDKFLYTPKTVDRMKSYIRSCKAEIANGEFKEKDLDFLAECIEFAQGGVEEISIYARAAIHFKQYDKALIFISSNMGNEGVTREDREKLRALIASITKAMKKTKAVEMIQSPTPNIEEIRAQTGLSEIEIVSILNKVYVEVPDGKVPKNSHDEVDGH